MIRCSRRRGSQEVRVSFVLPADSSERALAVAGDFNGWDPVETRFRKRGDERVASVTVEAGRRYAFRYVGDGDRWFNDADAHGYEPNEYGETNCVLDLTENTP